MFVVASNRLTSNVLPIVLGVAATTALWTAVNSVYMNFIRKRVGGPLQLPFVGSILSFDFKDFDTGLQKLYTKYGPTFEFAMFGGARVLTTCDYETMKDIFLKRDEFSHADDFIDGLSFISGPTMFLSEGDEWRERHRVLQPLMNHTMLQKSSEYVFSRANYLADHVKPGIPFDIQPIIDAYSFDASAFVLFGMELNLLENPAKSLRGISLFDTVDIINNAGLARMIFLPRILWNFPFPSFRKERKTYYGLCDLFVEALKSHAEKPVKDDTTTLVHQLVHSLSDASTKTHKYSTQKEIFAECFSLFIGGHDSTVFTLGIAIRTLGLFPEVQSKLQAEIDSVYAKTNGAITFETLSDMPYLENVLKEVTRLYPFAPVILRKSVKQQTLRDIYFSKGDMVWLGVYAYHFNPQYFPEPTKFDPERWERNPAVPLLSFGLGTRMCFGKKFAMEQMKFQLITLLRKFSIKIPPNKEYKVVQAMGAHATNGVWVELTPRNTN